jgi:hypothetical protein
MLDMAATVMELHGSPLPTLHWAYMNLKPRIKRARRVKDDCITKQLRTGVERLDDTTGKIPSVTCAVDQMILREKSLAKKDGRETHLFSRVIIDEARTLSFMVVKPTPEEKPIIHTFL